LAITGLVCTLAPLYAGYMYLVTFIVVHRSWCDYTKAYTDRSI